ncbi:MAG: hypothetical protein WC745_04995 [Patescibacteria group bacterium]|jgi:hypothetical protein
MELIKHPAEREKIFASQIEAGNLPGAVIQRLNKIGTPEARKLAAEIEDGRREINGLEISKFIEMGKQAELATDKGGDGFDSTDYLIMRAQLLADKAINNPDETAPIKYKEAA